MGDLLRARPGRRISSVAVLLVALQFGLPTNIQTSDQARPGLGKLSTVLADLARGVSAQAPAAREAPTPFALDAMPKSVRDAARGRMLRFNAKAEVQVYILMNPVTDERLRALAEHGVTVEFTDVPGNRVQARVPVSRLEGVAALPFVNFIMPPNYAIRMTGSVTSEGDEILRSDQARNQLGLSGAGVRVGVISDGIKGIFATGCTTCTGAPGGPISSGDLPASTGTRNTSGVLTSSSGGIIGTSFVSGFFGDVRAGDLEGLPTTFCGFAGAGAEGTALLEIIHDIAPGAQLAFANIDTDVAMIQAVNFLAASNDIVVDDLGFIGLPTDGTSNVSTNTANALNNNANRIRGYYTSVGNAADNHYYGLYVNSGVSGSSISSGITTAGNAHLFQSSADTTDVLGLGPQPFNRIFLPAGGEVVVIVTWDDPFSGSSNNYDLYLVRDSTDQVVASSTDPQNGFQPPREFIDYVNNTGSSGYFHIVLQNVNNAAAPKNFNLFAFEPQCAVDGPRPLVPGGTERLNYTTPTRSVPAQSDAGGSPVSVVSVGAICSASPRVFGAWDSCADATHSTIEFFSSLGPTLDGRIKPDVSSIDGVSVTGSGNFVDPFFGTSAAAPHVAGMAALVLQSAPCLMDGKPGALGDVTGRTNLRNLILDNAVPLGGTIPNNTFGYGRADALASVEQTLPTFGGPSAFIASGTSSAGASFTPAQLGFSDPNSCLLTRLNWTGGCGTGPAASMTCPFGTNNINVRASNNGVSFSDPASVQITVTNFSVGASPASQTVTAGDAATYTVTVSAQGGEYSNPVTLGCTNLPPETSCSFNPPAVTPGATSATSTLTVTTTAAPAAAAPSGVGRGRKPMGEMVGFGLAVLFAIVVLNLRTPRRRRIAATGAAAVALAALALQISCGGGETAPPPSAPRAQLSPTSLTFAAQGVGTTSAAQDVTLSNSGNAPLSISGISTSGDFAQTNNCGASLAAGTNCAIHVTFTPTAAGERTGTLSATNNAAGSPHTASLTGTGTAGTPTGAHPFNITGTAGTLVNSSSVELVVQ